MRKLPFALAVLSLLPASLAIADPETENLRIQNLETLKNTEFCFRNEFKTNEGVADIPIPSRSKHIRCSLRQNANGFTRIGRCPRPDDFTAKVTYGREDELKDPSHKEGEFTADYLAHLKKNPKAAKEAPPTRFRFGLNGTDARGNYINHPLTRFQKERVQLPPPGSKAKPKKVQLNEMAIKIDSFDFTAFVCYPKNPKDKKYNIESMNVGDLYDALKSKISFAAFPDEPASGAAGAPTMERGNKTKTPSSPKAKKAL